MTSAQKLAPAKRQIIPHLLFDKSGSFSTEQTERYWSKVDIRSANECWPWLASKGGGGYGHIFLNGHYIDSHRVSFMICHGTIAPGMCVLHSCPEGDRRDCCNPLHLREGTKRDNRHDALKRGRTRTVASIEVIKLIAAAPVFTMQDKKALAKQHGLSMRYVTNILTGRQFAVVTGKTNPRAPRKGREAESIQIAA